MKRLIIFIYLVYSNTLFASIGEISAINGKAVIFRDALQIDAKSHMKIEKNDKIKTLKDTKLQIIFNDKTIISLGQKSYVQIDDYIFDKNSVKASFNVNGIFKSITGKIGHISPKNFKLHTKNATIGVRGTTILGESRRSFDSIICSSGKIIVTSDFGVVVVNQGQRTIIKRGKAPTKPIAIDKAIIKKIDNISNTTITKKQHFTKPQHYISTRDMSKNITIKEQISKIKSDIKTDEKIEKIEKIYKDTIKKQPIDDTQPTTDTNPMKQVPVKNNPIKDKPVTNPINAPIDEIPSTNTNPSYNTPIDTPPTTDTNPMKQVPVKNNPVNNDKPSVTTPQTNHSQDKPSITTPIDTFPDIIDKLNPIGKK